MPTAICFETDFTKDIRSKKIMICPFFQYIQNVTWKRHSAIHVFIQLIFYSFCIMIHWDAARRTIQPIETKLSEIQGNFRRLRILYYCTYGLSLYGSFYQSKSKQVGEIWSLVNKAIVLWTILEKFISYEKFFNFDTLIGTYFATAYRK